MRIKNILLVQTNMAKRTEKDKEHNNILCSRCNRNNKTTYASPRRHIKLGNKETFYKIFATQFRQYIENNDTQRRIKIFSMFVI